MINGRHGKVRQPTGFHRGLAKRAVSVRRDKGTETRSVIIDAAVELFEEKGYEATSVEDVVRHVGLSKGAFYHYFEGKDELLLLIHDSFVDYELRVIREIVKLSLSPRETLVRIIEEIVVSVEVYQPHIAIFFEQRRYLSDVRFAQVKKKRDEFTNEIVNVIEEGVRIGEFANVPSSRVLAFGIVGMCSWTYQWFRRGALTAREVGQLYAKVVVDGICRAPDSGE